MADRGPLPGRYDVVVIGGGPAGSFSALKLSSMGFSTLLVDGKHVIGRPVQCAGLVNSGMFDIPGLSGMKEKLVLGSIRGADIFSPSGTMLPIMAKDVKAYSIDRSMLDGSLLKEAAGNGAEVLMGHRFSGIGKGPDGCTEVIVYGPYGKRKILSRMVIGSDGPASKTRSLTGLKPAKETVPGVSMEIELGEGSVPRDRVAVLTGEATARGFFSWIIPSFGESGIRLGLSAVDGDSLRSGLKGLFKDRRVSRFLSLEHGLTGYGVISRVYGSVPMGQPGSISKGSVLLLGDSAGMAKPTSGGGIYPAMLAVCDLCSVLDEGREPGPDAVKGFLQRWRKGYGKELTKTFTLRKIFRELKDEEMNRGLDALNDERKLELINEKGDIDHPVQLAISLLKYDPSLLTLIPRFIPLLRHLM